MRGPRLRRDRLVRTGGQGSFEPLIDPECVPAKKARLPDDEIVIGLYQQGVAKAYPTRMLWLHHAVNDMLFVRYVLVGYCNLSSAGIVFDPVVKGRRLTFEVFGVYQGAMVMRDHQTGSLWSHLKGESLRGRLRGHRLRPVAAVQLPWAEWRELHPDTLVLSDNTAYRDRYRPVSAAKARQGSGFRCFPVDWRPALAGDELVLGIEIEKRAWAYPLVGLAKRGPVVNDSVAGLPIVIFYSRAANHAVAYWRELLGTTLDFEYDGTHIRDGETGSIWSAEGRCVKGGLEGRSLIYLPAMTVEWYAWSAYHPQTEVRLPS